MPGKLRHIPGLKGWYYRRPDGKYRYKGKRYSKYSPIRDAKRHAHSKIKKQRGRYYPHTGDQNIKRRTKQKGKLGWF